MSLDALDPDRALRGLTDEVDGACPLVTLTKDAVAAWVEDRSEAERAWIEAAGFAGKAGQVCLLPGADGAPLAMLAGLGGNGDGFWAHAGLPARLPEGTYALEPAPEAADATRIALGWALGGYDFDRYRSGGACARLVWPEAADRDTVRRDAVAVQLTRDLINTPTNDMGPSELQAAAEALAERFGAAADTIVGEDLLEQGFPAVHAVGRAADATADGRRAPRLIDLRWGREADPRVTVVGKGVCFDSGGLDIKPAQAMRLMKKDMGGAANALGLAYAVMAAGLPVRLRVLVPAVENAIAGDAFRPGDVLRTRKGLTVEVGNTDAEGRLVLADALACAAEEEPALLLDFATLTGAARVALGPDLPALFASDETLAIEFMQIALQVEDPVWCLPLWRPYRSRLDSKVADIGNISEGPFAGAITAALFLQEFVGDGPWAHLDCFAWNPTDRPGRPTGGEATGLRAAYALIVDRFASADG